MEKKCERRKTDRDIQPNTTFAVFGDTSLTASLNAKANEELHTGVDLFSLDQRRLAPTSAEKREKAADEGVDRKNRDVLFHLRPNSGFTGST